MILRVISGIAGVGIVIVAFTWTQVLRAPSEGLPGMLPGFLTAGVITGGVYLMFYCLTGDWLPRLTKRRDRR